MIGRSFGDGLLRAVLPDLSAIDKALGELYTAHFVWGATTRQELDHVFKHALVHDVASLSSILPQQRRDLHRLVATRVEREYADRLDDFFSVLARHFANAGEWAKAREYLVQGGQPGQSGVAADAEALASYREDVGRARTRWRGVGARRAWGARAEDGRGAVSPRRARRSSRASGALAH